MQRLVLILLACIAARSARKIDFENKRNEEVWVGAQGNPGKDEPEGGGWKMEPHGRRSVNVSDNWAGRFWVRTVCHSDGSHCATGDCGRGTKCGGNGGEPPATLAEFTLSGWQGLDYYDISLVDGFNVPISIEPKSRGCETVACKANLNAKCPPDFIVEFEKKVVACKSYPALFKDECPQANVEGGEINVFTCSKPDYKFVIY